MSMSTSVIGQRIRDETFEKYFKVLKSCMDADLYPPQEVVDYFGENNLDCLDPAYVAEAALEVNLDHIVKNELLPGHQDYIINIAELPESVATVIFRNSW